MKIFLPTVLVVLVCLQAYVLTSEPEFAFGVTLLRDKALGRLDWIGWGKALDTAVPSYLRPRRDSIVAHRGAYVLSPVRQVSQEDEACGYLWDTELGRFWTNGEEGDLLAFLVVEQVRNHIYEHQGVRIEEGDTVLDGGAHIGVFARHALNQGAGKVIAFEPDPRNIACLEKNFEQDIASGSLEIVRAALWHEPTKLVFHLSNENTARNSAIRSEGTEVEVSAVTIDDEVKKLGLESVDFIKLDIEGAERHAMQGAGETLRTFRPRLALSTYHLPDDPAVISSIVLRSQPDYSVSGTREVAFFW